MANVDLVTDKDFQNNNGKNGNHKSIQTLHSAVTICLGSCTSCTGEYIDITHSFKMNCLCNCHSTKVAEKQ